MLDPKTLETYKQALDKMVRKNKLETLKRWGQADCERCGRPLETLFDSHGKNPIRICVPCEHARAD
jgi:hypothetical protein